MTTEFVSPLDPQPELVVEFHRIGPSRLACALCGAESPLGGLLMRWVDTHLRDQHPDWGEAKVETR